MNPETRFIHQFRARLPKDWMFTRIETSTESGVPDAVIGNKRGDIWVEFKACENSPIRAQQLSWWHRAVAAGRLVTLACRSALADDRLHLINLSAKNFDWGNTFSTSRNGPLGFEGKPGGYFRLSTDHVLNGSQVGHVSFRMICHLLEAYQKQHIEA